MSEPLARNMHYSIFTILFLLRLLPYCQGQEEAFFFHHLNRTNSELSQADNLHVFKDSRGLVWISSQSGLNCFDGKNVRVYQSETQTAGGLFGENIQSGFFEDRDGNLWFTTYEAVNCFERKSGAFRHFPENDDRGQHPAGYRALGLYRDRDLWVVNEDGNLYALNRFTGSFTPLCRLPFPVQRGVIDLDKDGMVRSVLAFSLNAYGLIVVPWQEGVPSAPQLRFAGEQGDANLLIRGVLKDSVADKYWLATNQGLFLFDPESGELHAMATWPSGNPDVLNACAQYKQDYLLCATAKSGLWLFSKRERAFVQQIRHNDRDPHSLTGDNISNIYIDDWENIWVSVGGEGVDFTNAWQRKPFSQLLTKGDTFQLNRTVQIGPMIEDREGRIWCSVWQQGLFLFDRNKRLITHFGSGKPPPHDLVSNYITFLFVDSRHRIWLATYRGLELYDERQKRFLPIAGLDQQFIYAIELRDGTVLFCHYSGGVYQLTTDTKGEFAFVLRGDFDASKAYTALYECSDGRLVAAAETVSINEYTPGAGNVYRLSDEIFFNGIIPCFWENKSKNELWAATSNGLVVIDLIHFNHIVLTEKNGLADRCVHAIVPVNDDEVWISTNRGLSRLDPRTRRCRNYSYSDGLGAYEFRNLAALRRLNGELWFGSVNGITIVERRRLADMTALAIPQITRIRINDMDAQDAGSGQNPTEVQKKVLRYADNTFSLYLAALEYSDPTHTRSRYFLEGIDKDTIDFEGHGWVRYPNLPPGKYRFSVWAANSDDIWNSVPRTLEVEILPPFWQRWWFILVCAGALFFLVWYAHTLRLRQKMRIFKLQMERRTAVEQERKRIARDMHDDIGSGLSELGLQAELIRQKVGKSTLRADLKKLTQSSRDISIKLRELIWTVYSQNDTLEKLVDYLRMHALAFFENTGTVCIALLPTDIPSCAISGQKRHMILMAFKEALNNIVKHAGAQQVHIAFEDHSSYYDIVIRDDGRGFEYGKTVKPDGYGLSNMQERMEVAGGRCTIVSGSQGTTVILSLRIEPDSL